MTHTDSQDVLTFWFGASNDDAETASLKRDLWWGGSDEIDRQIESQFGDAHRAAINGALTSWLDASRKRLAAIILVDQFSRNMHPGTPPAFAHDDLSRRWCLDGIAGGDDRQLRLIERVFFYLPLEHSESRNDQAHCVQLMDTLASEVPDAWRETFNNYADFARRHRDVIERFGRFPHRNKILGRPSTDEEIIFLREPGSSF